MLATSSIKPSKEGEELRLRDSGPGFPATVDYLKYGATSPWPKARSGYSIELRGVGPNLDVDPDVDNDFGDNWSLSNQPGGSPSSRLFIRGDVNDDTLVDLSDAVGFLVFFVLGGEAPGCLDSADMDDTGVLDITDPIYLLSHLFLGSKAPPAPFPNAGADPTPDDGLSCD